MDKLVEKLVLRDKIVLKDEISINGIYTFIYQERSADFIFPGETHDFWELIYMDKGFAYLLIDDNGYKINQGELFFFNRNQNHILWSDSKVAPFFLTISFDMDFSNPQLLEYKPFKIDRNIKELLERLIFERLESFEGSITSNISCKKESSLMFCEQMLKIRLTELIIMLVRTCKPNTLNSEATSTIRKKTEEIVFSKASQYIHSNLFNIITSKDVCCNVNISHSHLNRIFNRVCGSSICAYINTKKLEEAKKLIRLSGMSITQVSQELNYNSVHYFSRLFKKEFNLSPYEYAKSINS